MEEMRFHRESISLIKGETGTGTPVAKADTSVRIQRQEEIHACSLQTEASLRRSIYGIARRVPADLFLSLSRLLIRPPILSSFARSSADHSSPLSTDGEPLSKSYATQRRSSTRALIIFPRAAVPEFLNGG